MITKIVKERLLFIYIHIHHGTAYPSNSNEKSNVFLGFLRFLVLDKFLKHGVYIQNTQPLDVKPGPTLTNRGFKLWSDT